AVAPLTAVSIPVPVSISISRSIAITAVRPISGNPPCAHSVDDNSDHFCPQFIQSCHRSSTTVAGTLREPHHHDESVDPGHDVQRVSDDQHGRSINDYELELLSQDID